MTLNSAAIAHVLGHFDFYVRGDKIVMTGAGQTGRTPIDPATLDGWDQTAYETEAARIEAVRQGSAARTLASTASATPEQLILASGTTTGGLLPELGAHRNFQAIEIADCMSSDQCFRWVFDAPLADTDYRVFVQPEGNAVPVIFSVHRMTVNDFEVTLSNGLTRGAESTGHSVLVVKT